jgi:hypothetical protein
LEEARRRANELSRPWGHNGPTPEECWNARAGILAEERDRLLAVVAEQRPLARHDLGVDERQELNHYVQSEVDRLAMTRTLIALGLLEMKAVRRSAPDPKRPKPEKLAPYLPVVNELIETGTATEQKKEGVGGRPTPSALVKREMRRSFDDRIDLQEPPVSISTPPTGHGDDPSNRRIGSKASTVDTPIVPRDNPRCTPIEFFSAACIDDATMSGALPKNLVARLDFTAPRATMRAIPDASTVRDPIPLEPRPAQREPAIIPCQRRLIAPAILDRLLARIK